MFFIKLKILINKLFKYLNKDLLLIEIILIFKNNLKFYIKINA
jgi:hypothetical protein